MLLFLPEPRPEQAFEFDISPMKSHSTCSYNMQLSTDKNCTPESRIIAFKKISKGIKCYSRPPRV